MPGIVLATVGSTVKETHATLGLGEADSPMMPVRSSAALCLQPLPSGSYAPAGETKYCLERQVGTAPRRLGLRGSGLAM